MRMWNAERHRELVAAEGAARQRMHEIATRINDRAHTDHPITAEDSLAYSRDAAEHAVASRQHELARHDLERMEELRPLDPATQRDPSALMRFLRVGSRELSAEERQAHVLSEPPGMGGSMPHGITLHPSDLQGIALPPGARDAEFFIERLPDPQDYVRAALTRSDESPGGGDWHSPRTVPYVTDRLSAYGGALRLVSVLMTGDGVTLAFPQLDDANEKGEYLTNQAAAASAGDFSGVRDIDLETQIIGSKYIDISIALVQDSTFDVEGMTRRRMDRRIGRGTCEALVVGTGADKTPRGITLDAATGVTTAAANKITAGELSDLMSSVDVAYVDGEDGPAGLPSPGGMTGTGWLMHQDVVGELRKLAGTDGHPIWLPSVRDGDPMRLYGKPVQIDNAMPEIAASAKVAAYGNFGYYMFREVRFAIVSRFYDSGTASNFKLRFLAWKRNGGRFVGGFSGGNTCEAVKVLAMHA